MSIPHQLHQLQRQVRKEIDCPSFDFGGKNTSSGLNTQPAFLFVSYYSIRNYSFSHIEMIERPTVIDFHSRKLADFFEVFLLDSSFTQSDD
jgi:hypothetical protein